MQNGYISPRAENQGMAKLLGSGKKNLSHKLEQGVILSLTGESTKAKLEVG